ncbi:hypothetical protein CSPHI_08425 [Corynebacterium sphenisci DSM 44792]|uniref:Integrase n=1 Tax=Corynebacterium sphenisci DSM 44792 TaxID=1437874 RepID=A0A1L7CZ82_9CORY|nr:site-specific integrase [Corynebacterium sphenisci]APT91051.1 hypothetical protein CSPHI_08425 [Corynebacterium sphenisci DSM 44792]
MATTERYQTQQGVRWRARWRTAAGGSRSRSGFKTKGEATRFLASVEVSKAQGGEVDTQAARRPLREYYAGWLAGVRATAAPSTAARYEGLWRSHVAGAWADRQVGSIKVGEIQKWVADLASRRSASTCRQALQVLRGSLDAAEADAAVARNPARGRLRVPAQPDTAAERVFLTGAQARRLIEATRGEGQKALVMTLLGTGLRFGEAAALRPCDRVGPGRWRVARAVTVISGRAAGFGPTKGRSARTIAAPPAVDAAMMAQARRRGLEMDSDDLLWVTPRTGAPLVAPSTREGAHSWLAAAVDRCQEADSTYPRPRVHDLRHTYASLAIAGGASVVTVASQLGHSSPAVTLSVYSHAFSADLDAAAGVVGEALDLTRI